MRCKRLCAVLWLAAVAALTQQKFNTTKHPLSTEDFTIDYAKVATNNALTSSSWTISPVDTLSKVSDTFTATKTIIRLAGGSNGKNYVVTNQATLADGQVLVATLNVSVAR